MSDFQGTKARVNIPNDTNTDSGDQLASRIAEWATNELGFRKKSTLVTAKGEEALTEADIMPLLQGELSRVLSFASDHLLSSERIKRARAKLDSYYSVCANDEKKPLDYITLRNTIDGLVQKDKSLSQNINETEAENQHLIQHINELESKTRLLEEKIRARRMNLVIKQATAENHRKLIQRMGLLIEELKNSEVATNRRFAESVPRVLEAYTDQIKNSTPSQFLLLLISEIQKAAEEIRATADSWIKPGIDSHNRNGNKNKFRQLEIQDLIATIIVSLKELHDRHIKACVNIESLREKVAKSKDKVLKRIDSTVGQINMKAVTNGREAHDYACAVLQATFSDAVKQVSSDKSKIQSTALASNVSPQISWVKPDTSTMVEKFIVGVNEMKEIIARIHNASSQINQTVKDEFVPESDRILKALHHVDLREVWNSINLASLQVIELDDGAKSSTKAIDTLVTRDPYLDRTPGRTISTISTFISGSAGQANDVVVTKFARHLLQDIQKGYELYMIQGELSAHNANINQLASGNSSDIQSANSRLVDFEKSLEDFCKSSREYKVEAQNKSEKWEKENRIKKTLQLVCESVETENNIDEIVDASGKLFKESFAPSNKRDGVSYSECVKRLNIARANGNGPS